MAHRRSAMTVSLLIATMISAGLSACTAGGSDGPVERVSIGSTTFPASAIIFIAEEQGYFEDEGLDATVRTYDAGTLALDDAVAGDLDFAAVAETPVARAAVAGKQFRVLTSVAEVDRANYIIARKDRGIESAEDLEGKRLGFAPGTTGDYFQQMLLSTLLVDASAVTRVELEPAQVVDALVDGEVDAVSTWPPFTSRLEEALGDNAVILDEPGLYVMSWNVVRAEKGGPSREASVALLRALVRAEEFIADEPEAAREIAARRTGVPADELERLWPDLRFDVALGQALLLSLEDEARWMVEDGGSMPDFLNFIDPEPLREVRPGRATIVMPGD